MTVAGWSRRRRGLVAALAVYLLVLMASHAARASRPERPPTLAPDQIAAEVPTVRFEEGEPRLGPETVRMAYRDLGPRDAPALVLVHGSPGSSSEFRRLAPLLAESRRVLIPDLPGFGASARDLPDYGVDAHALQLERWVDELGIERADWLGYSLGGGVVLELADRAPERVRSLTLLSAIGVQELELMGEYHLNHAVHGLQVGLLWLMLEGLPHFGRLDGGMFGLPYARNFYDTDQRPLRGALERYADPLLIVHAPDDVLVPIEAAREHARIVPQAELFEIDVQVDIDGTGESGPPSMIRGHLLPQMDSGLVAPLVAGFLERVDAGTATVRADADPERVTRSELPFESVPLDGMGLVIAMVLIAAATLVSEDLTCIATGALVAQGRIDLASGALACFLGIYVGDLLLFLTGRLAGSRALRVPPLSWMLDDNVVERAARWFDHRGLSAIFLTRFMPGTRLPTYFAAGALKTNALLFAVYFAIAAGVWTPILVWLSSLIGGNLQENVELFERALPLGLLATVVVGLVAVKVLVPMCTWRGRRRLLGSWLRKRHWEFWSPFLFYPPVLVSVLWRGIRAGRLTAFCACNPAIPFGGFINESKADILRGLDGAGDAIPRWTGIPGELTGEQRLERLERFVAEELGGVLPVVLKPDAGQRGSGVLVAKTLEEARDYVSATHLDLIAQAFAGGPEYGVFYARRRSEDAGRVVSITIKRPAEVVGDGQHTLEELILRDRRAVALAETYLRRNAARLDQVPEKAERVRISDLGTHALGAIFEDGNHLCTPELEAAVHAIAAGFEGFHFGRFDLRCPSEQHLREGRELSVIELNGVTSEMTHVYDRRHSVWYGWRTILGQWKLAFEIAAENRAAGVEAPSTFAMLRELVRYRRGAREHRS